MSARSLNKVIIIGNLTRDPELRYTPSGTAVCSFSIATNRDWVDSNGQKQEEVEFHRVVSWNKLAEICSQLLNKGRKVYVEGRLQTRTWQGQDGQERQTTEVVINEMIALGEPRGGGETMVDAGADPDQGYVPEKVFEVEKEEEGKKNKDKNESKAVADSGKEKKEKEGDKKTKSTAAEVADDIPF